MADGYIARTPTSAWEEVEKKYYAINSRNYLDLLESYQINYLISTAVIENPYGVTMTTIYDTPDLKLYAIEKNELVSAEINSR